MVVVGKFHAFGKIISDGTIEVVRVSRIRGFYAFGLRVSSSFFTDRGRKTKKTKGSLVSKNV